jgi:hypothetical protein
MTRTLLTLRIGLTPAALLGTVSAAERPRHYYQYRLCRRRRRC